jgi:hypothetical protein
MPGKGVLMEGAMQQAAQLGRQIIVMNVKTIARQFTSTQSDRRWVNMETNCPQ